MRMRVQTTCENQVYCVSIMATSHLRGLRESVWLEQAKYEQAEGSYHEALARSRAGLSQVSKLLFVM